MRRLPDMSSQNLPNLSLKHIWSVVVIAFPLGIFGLWAFTNLPGMEGDRFELGEWQTSSWFFITQVWAGLALLALIYWYGFRWWLMIPMSLYLLVMAYQGYHRFRVIIPAVLLIQIYLDRRKLKWPPIYVLGVILLLMMLFFPLKDIGRLAQEGEGVEQIVDVSRQSVNSSPRVQSAGSTVPRPVRLRADADGRVGEALLRHDLSGPGDAADPPPVVAGQARAGRLPHKHLYTLAAHVGDGDDRHVPRRVLCQFRLPGDHTSCRDGLLTCWAASISARTAATIFRS